MLSETWKRVRDGIAVCVGQTPVLIMAGFLAGVAIHSFYPLASTPTWVWCGMATLVLGLSVLSASEARARRMFFFALACAVGILRFDLTVPPSEIPSGENRYVGTVADVQSGMYGLQAKVAIEGIVAQINLKQPVPIGSKIEFTCAFKRLEKGEEDLDRRYAANYHRAQARCSAKDLTVAAQPAWWDARQTFADLRSWTTARISSAMPGDEGALIAGMLYGERGMSKEAQDRFRRAGLTHLIAVSGSNITIVASVVFALLMGLGLWRRQAFWATSAALFTYVSFTGFSASVARAAAMGWLVLLARHVGRPHRTWHVLLVSAAALNLIDPWMLAYDAGFALSFLATVGLMVWTPIFTERFKIIPEVAGLRETVATTCGATLMTLPYMAFAFERASLAGLFTNVVAVPLVPYAMLFGAAAAAWGGFVGSALVSAPAMGLAKTVFLSAKLADVLPWLDIHIARMDFALCLATYALLGWIWFCLSRKSRFSTGK